MKRGVCEMNINRERQSGMLSSVKYRGGKVGRERLCSGGK